MRSTTSASRAWSSSPAASPGMPTGSDYSCAAAQPTTTCRSRSAGRLRRAGRGRRLEVLFCALDDLGVAAFVEAVPGIFAALRVGLASHRFALRLRVRLRFCLGFRLGCLWLGLGL